jgi:cytochrome c oxidase assembly protein subunit 15
MIDLAEKPGNAAAIGPEASPPPCHLTTPPPSTYHSPLTTHHSPKWFHLLALLTVCATFALLLLGAVVTTFRFGMADPIWPTYPWHLLLISWQEPRPGFLIEHAHRLAGYIVGCCTIALAVGLWLREPRRWVRWLGTVALLGVTLQGLIGGFRVKLDAWLGRDLAPIHGCFAQIVFGLLVSLAVVTSRGWVSASATVADSKKVNRLKGWSIAAVGLVYLQIIFGALVRHTYSVLGQRGHILIAFAVVAVVAWLVKETIDLPVKTRALVIPVGCLAVLVTLQLLVGVEAWMVRLTSVAPAWEAIIRTTHVLMGSLIFASTIVVALQTYRQTIATSSGIPSWSDSVGGTAVRSSQQEEAA